MFLSRVNFMNRRKAIWSVVILAFLLGALFVWQHAGPTHVGSPAVAQPAASAEVHSPATADRVAQITVTPASTAPFALFTLNKDTNASVVTAAVKRTERLKYRLSNTSETVGQLLSNPKALHLENALIDSSKPLDFTIPDSLKSEGDPGTYIVQARGSINDAFRQALQAAGAVIVSYIPNNAYLVRMTAGGAQQLAGVAQPVLPWEPYYKLDLGLLKNVIEGRAVSPSMNVLVFADARVATLAALEKLGVVVTAESPSPFGVQLALQNVKDAAALARVAGVQRVETSSPRQLANDLTRARVKVSTNSVTGNNYLNLSGKNVTVDMNDTGVDSTHPDLINRMFSFNAASLFDANGHGTHVAGIIVGDGSMSTTVTNAAGSINPGTTNQYRGKAPAANLFVMPIDDVFSDFQLQSAAARTNALISNNSWGYANQGYDIASASYDAAVRDALPEKTGSQPVLFVFAAGNGGNGDDGGVSGSPESIVSPATSKNGITVGAIELPRRITNEVLKITAGVTNRSTPWIGMTDSSNQVAGFSARGNVGIGIEGDFGRFKPDVVAPGTFVVSTRTQTPWDELSYYNPTNYIIGNYTHETVTTNGLRVFPSVFVPNNAVRLVIQAFNTEPIVNLPIYVRRNNVPTTNTYDVLANNLVTLPPDAPLVNGTIYYFGVGDPTNQPLTFDLQVTVVTTNDAGNYFEVLSNLNNSIGDPDWYRYESGTSMAAPAVSGVLALMQEFFQLKQITNSPALMKALLINGARPVSGVYDFQVQNSINYQGWGLVSLSNSLPESFTNVATVVNPPINTSRPMLMFDQSPTNALATGESRTIKVSLSSLASDEPLRVTLVWTDPPGNPAAGVKLVNNLDLVVTNLDDPSEPLVYFGNDIQAGANFNVEWDTNGLPNLDLVNNVENIYLSPTLGTNYSITVIARSVNVNAVTAHTNGIVQDYALVISSGNGQLATGLTLNLDAGIFTPNATNVTVMTNSFGATNPNIFGQALGEQRVGANSPLMDTNVVPDLTTNGLITLGETNQWHFYIITNTTSFTNALFATSLPIDLAASRMGVTNTLFTDQAARLQADIDLYVSTDSKLITLDPAVMTNALKSLGRGGFEQIVISNAVQNQVYYIGVKSEDQLAAEYTLTALFSLLPFNNGDNTFTGFPTPAVIPDGSPALPGAVAVTAYAVAAPNVHVRRATLTNIITHENFGDLIGTLTHDGAKPVVLNNHTFGNSQLTQQNVYEDTGADPAAGSRQSDGPGSLAGYIGDIINGQWSLVEVDNALTHTGRVDGLSIHLDPIVQNDLPPGATTGVIASGCLTIQSKGYEPFPAVLPFNATADRFCIYSNALPLQLVARNGALPTRTTFDYTKNIAPGGDCLTVDLSDLPPLQPGLTLFWAVINSNAAPVDFCYTNTLTRNLLNVTPVAFASSGAVPIPDDAISYSSIQITNNKLLASAAVGVVLNHPRVSDLTLTLISPTGGRYVLFEDRGGLNATNLGHLHITTNFFGTTTAGGATANTNVLTPVATSGILRIDYNFFTVPDTMDVYYDGVLIYSTGLIGGNNGGVPLQIPYGPGTGTSITIVMNQGNNSNTGTRWVYTPNVENDDYTYLTFTDDPALATTPIKFGVPPFDLPGTGINFNLSDFELATNGDYFASNNIADAFGGWNLYTNTLIGTNLVALDHNQVSVITDTNVAQAGTNFLALALGTINRSVPMTAGKKYTLTYYYRGPGIAGWWRGEGNALDGSDPEVLGNNGSLIGRFEFPGGAVGQAFQMEDAGQQFRFAGTNSYVQIRQSISLDVGTGSGMTVEGWINPTNISFQQPLVEWLAFVPTNGPTYYVQDGITNRSSTNVDIIAGPFLNRATDHYYYLLGTNSWTKSEQIAISLGGHLATLDDANEANWIVDTFAQYGGTNHSLWIGLTNTAGGNFFWANGQTSLFYTNWAAAQPSNCVGNEHYVSILSPTNVQAGLWVLADNTGRYCGGPPPNRTYGVVEVNEIQTNGVQLWVSVTNSTLAGNGRLYANLVDTNNVSHIFYSAAGLVQSNVYQHVALTYNTNTGVANLYYNGTNVASTNFGGIVFTPKTGGDVLLGRDMSRATNNFYGGKMDEVSIYNRSLSASEIAAIYRLSAPATNINSFTNPIVGKFDPTITPPLSLAEAQVSLGGITNVILGANNGWQVQGFTFTATTNSLPMQIVGQQPGILLDSFAMAQAPPGNLYYLPEEVLSDLVGQNASGKWTLEINDSRAGNTGSAGELVSWEMQMIFQNTAPTAVPLSPFLAATNIVPAGKTAYFTVDVPSWASYATNILVSSSVPVDLLFNQTNPPTGTAPGDFVLLTASTGGAGGFSSPIVANGVPPLLRSQRYYLGVRNSGAADATAVVRVDYDILTLTNSVPVKNFLNTNDTVRYFAFDVSSNAIEATFQVLKISSNVDLVISQGAPLPTLTSSAYGSFNAANADEAIYVLTNSTPVPLSAGRWYLGVFKRVAEPLTFSVLAKELDPPLPNIIDLVNNVPFDFTTGPGAALTNFFRFGVSNSPASLRFELYNQTGNGDLTVQTNAAPYAPPFYASSQQPGRGVELIFLHTNSMLTNLNQQWYLGVPNHETNPISYTIVASIDTNSYFPAFPGAQGAGGGSVGGRGGDVYHVFSLADSGFGSLRDAVNSATTNRTVVFDVSGTIVLLSPLIISNSNLTIAGQTAPGGGITIIGQMTALQNLHDVIIRYLRFRPGGSGVVWANGFEGITQQFNVTGYFYDGWHVDSGNVDILDGYLGSTAYKGANYLDLNGIVPGAISTNLPTVVGRTYRLNFAYSRNPDGTPPLVANILQNSNLLTTLSVAIANSWPNLNWSTTSIVFVATAPMTQIQFASQSPGWYGVLLDDLSLTEVGVGPGDALQFSNATNIIADHVTASMSTASGLSALWSTNVTVQWSMISDNVLGSSTNSITNGLGSRLRYGNGALTFHHNLYADNTSANPRLGDNLKLDFVNNVVYNWGILPGFSTNDLADNPLGFTNYLNYVGNYLIAGQDTATNMFATAFLGGTTNTWIYQTNNLIDSNTNGILDGANTQWQMFTNDFVPAFYTRTNLVFPELALSIDETFIAYEKVLDFAGPAMDKRDLFDAGIVVGVRNQTGAPGPLLAPSQTNSLPFLDTDQDGAPDFWETTFGENPTNSTASFVDRDADGYTDLEEYLNWLAVPHALTVTNTSVGVDLVQMFGRTGNLSFSVTNSFNGRVYLTNVLGPLTNVMAGITNIIPAVTNTGPFSNSFAIFMPTNSTSGGTNFNGYAGFDVYVTNNDTIAYYGPVTVSVMVSAIPIVYAPINTNTAPVFIYTNLPNQVTNELTLLTVTNTATDANTNLTLSYTVSLTIDTNAMIANGWPLTYANTTNTSPTIDTNGVITWTPSEAQGPGVYIVTTVVSDNSIPPLRASNSFSVTVNEVNLAPFWPTNIPSQTNYPIAATTTLTVVNTAADSDIPLNPLSYVLSVSPVVTNAVISTNGIITWTPTPAQVGVYTFITIVSDTNQYALFNKSLSATNFFTVTVTAVAAPFAFTQPAQAVTGSSAKLNGMVTPNGLPTTAWYQWGTNTSYGNVTAAAPVGGGFNVVYLASSISGLVTNVPYHFRLVATNTVGITYGFDQILDEANVVVWGADYINQANVPAGLSNVVAIAGAYDHSLALRNNGTVAAWGDNTFNQTTVPGGLNNVLAVAGGQYYSMALKNTGTVQAWGNNILNQLGVPAGLNNVVTIAGGTYSSLALKNDGAVVVWGANFFNLTNSPVIPAINAVAIAGGSYHSLAIKNDGTVVVWGDNSANQTNVPPGLSNVVAIAGGNYHNLALRYNGTVVAWGDNSSGQTNVPTGLTNVVAVAAGGFNSLALKSDGTIVTWGDNSSGQSSVPVGLNQVVAIASGYFHNLALTPQVLASTNVILNLTNLVPQTNSIAAGGLTYYRVSVPTNVDFTTNSLLFTLTGSLNVFFSTNTPPSITNLNDYPLLAGSTNGVSILSTTSAPTNIVSGSVYYLGVQNTNSFTVTYGIEVDFHFFTVTNSPTTNTVPISSIVYTNIAGKNGFLLTWFAPSNYLFRVQWTPAIPTLIWTTFSNIISYNTNVFTSPTNTQFNFFDDGSQTGGFGPSRFYRLVLTPSATITTPLTNGVPVTNTIPAGAVNFYLVNVPTNADFATNILLFATNSPLNVWFSTNVPPSVAGTNDSLLIGGATNGSSILNTSTAPRLVPGSFYSLGVQNTNSVAVTYAIQVNFHLFTNPPPLFIFNSIIATNISGTNGFLLSWFAPTNAVFQVQWSPTVAPTNWQAFAGVVPYTGPVTTSNGLFTYFDNGAQFPFGPTRFYRFVMLTGNTAPVLPPGGQVYFINPLATLTVTNAATDLDLPANILTYVLSSTVANTNNLPAITGSSGVITWTPVATQVSTTNLFTTVVTDNGVPNLSATNNFTVVVIPPINISSLLVLTNGYRFQWTAPTNLQFKVQWKTNLIPTLAWNLFTNILTSTNGTFTFLDDGSQSGGLGPMRFYRLIWLP